MEDEDISKLDPDLIMARQLEELEKERKELQVSAQQIIYFRMIFTKVLGADKIEEPGEKS